MNAGRETETKRRLQRKIGAQVCATRAEVCAAQVADGYSDCAISRVARDLRKPSLPLDPLQTNSRKICYTFKWSPRLMADGWA